MNETPPRRFPLLHICIQARKVYANDLPGQAAGEGLSIIPQAVLLFAGDASARLR